MASTALSSLIVKKESSTAVAVTPTHPLRYKGGDIDLKRDTKKNNPIQNNRAQNIHPIPGKINSNGTYTVDLDFNECVYWLYMGKGGISSTDVSSLTDASAWQHVLTDAASLPSFTIQQQKGDISDTSNGRQNYVVSRAFGVMCDGYKISASDEEVKMEVDVVAHGIFQRSRLLANASAGSNVVLSLETVEGLVATTDSVNIWDSAHNETDAIASLASVAKTITIASLGNSYTVANGAKVELVPITPSYSVAPRVPAFHHVTFQFGADLTAATSAASSDMEDWELTHKNNLDVRFGSLRQTPSKIGTKRYEDSLKFSRFFENVTDRDNFLALKQQAMILTITDNGIISATDAGNKKYTVKIEAPDVRFDEYTMATEVDGAYVAEIVAGIYYDASNGFATRITVTNATAGTAYTA